MARMAARPSEACGRIRALAEDQRRALGHPYLGEEHLLLGVLAHGQNRAADLLTARGVDLDSARAGLERIHAAYGPLARDDAAVLAEFGVDVEAVRHRLESVFGAVAVHEAVRAGLPRHRSRTPAHRALTSAEQELPHGKCAPRANPSLDVALPSPLTMAWTFPTDR